jgi:hypothetical protein
MTDPRQPNPPGGLTCDQVRDLAAGFVLDALDPAEAAAVREHLAGCSEPHAEFAEMGGVIPALQTAIPVVEPPASLKTRLMAAAAADLEARRARPADVPSPVQAPMAPVPAPSADGVIRPFPRRATSLRGWALGIAAVLAIVALGGWNIALQQQLNDARAYEQQVASVLDAAQRPGSLVAVLRSADGTGPAGIAAVTKDGVARIAMQHLAPTSGTEVYEAWVIGGDGVPVAIGHLAVRATAGDGYLETAGLPAEPGIVLALTKEPKPGVTAPSGPPIAAGTATAG